MGQYRNLIIFFAEEDGEALHSQQDQELTSSDHELLTAKFRLKLKWGKPLDHSGMT